MYPWIATQTPCLSPSSSATYKSSASSSHVSVGSRNKTSFRSSRDDDTISFDGIISEEWRCGGPQSGPNTNCDLSTLLLWP